MTTTSLRQLLIAGAVGLLGIGCTSASTPTQGAERTNPATVKQAQVAGVPSVTTNPSYAAFAPIAVTFANLPPSATTTNWIAITTAGAPVETWLTYAYTGPPSSGTVNVPGVAAGNNYVARAFADDGFTQLGADSAPFTVTGAAVGTLTTDKASYTPAESATVSWTGQPGNARDWVALALPGSPASSYVKYQYAGGAAAGSLSFALAGLNGPYVVRYFLNDDFNLAQESAQFTVAGGGAATLTTDKSDYTNADSATLSWSGQPGNPRDWVALALPGSPASSYIAYQYTGGTAAGSLAFPMAGLDGSYVFRYLLNDDYVIAKEVAFTVNRPPPPPLTTNKASYASGETVTVSFAGLPGNQTDWIAISTAGSGNSSYVTYKYTAGAVSGSLMFTNLPAGTYEARAYENDTFNRLFTSATFTVGAAAATTVSTAATYTDAQTITVTYANMSGSATDWISIATQGSADNSYIAYVYTGGALNGTATFSAAGLAGGTYVARAYFRDSVNVEATSASFTVTAAP